MSNRQSIPSGSKITARTHVGLFALGGTTADSAEAAAAAPTLWLNMGVAVFCEE
ncbi:hypothetical protein TWF718_008651 [Orbilia javanica]|uniref:Uncharacterized protein n=1 Tax=Orbilia javanica TaxID=47235 RepID=A0AAN8RGD6_9PEZI